MAAFQLHISGLAGPLCDISADEDWRLVQLHKAVAQHTAIPIDQQRLIYGASILQGVDQLLLDLLPRGAVEIFCVRTKLWIEIPFYSGCSGRGVDITPLGNSQGCKTIDEAKAACYENEDLWGFTLLLEETGPSKKSSETLKTLNFKGVGTELGQTNRRGTTFVKLSPAGRSVLLDTIRKNTRGRNATVAAITDLDTMITAVEENPNLFRNVCDELRCNVNVAQVAVMSNPFALQFAPEEVRDDVNIIRKALEINAFSLQHASERVRSDRAIVSFAIERQPSTIRYASEDLRADPNICIHAIRKDGSLLRYLHADLQDNHTIVMAAVQQEGQALCFASCRLRANAEIIAAAVERDPEAAQFALGAPCSQ